MRQLKLQVVSADGVEATIRCDGQHGGHEDYYAFVWMPPFAEEKKIYGIDPIQAVSLALRFVETMTDDRRLQDGSSGAVAGADWRIEAQSA